MQRRKISAFVAASVILLAPSISSAHGGFAKVVDDYVVFINQDPISPVVGESVITYIQVMNRDIKPVADLPLSISLIDTAFGDEQQDRPVYTKRYKTNVNGSVNFEYTYDKENYFDIEIAFNDPVTGRHEQTGYLVQPRDSIDGYIGQQPTGQQRQFLTPEEPSKEMGIYFDALVASIAMLLGVIFFGRFEQSGSVFRRIARAGVVIGGTATLSYYFGHWALVLPVGMATAGAGFHFWWCWKNDINPITAEPYDRYLQLRGWK